MSDDTNAASDSSDTFEPSCAVPAMPEGGHSRIYLASRSPRRRELLTQIGIRFDPLGLRSDSRLDMEVDETPMPGEPADIYVERITRAKAAFGCTLLEYRRLPPQPVLAADTTVEFEGEIIGKPKDAAEAEAILRRLSGKTHRVLTAVAVSYGEHVEFALSTSQVRFRALEESEIAHYVASGEPMDKAGAYGIQGYAGMFVEHLNGSYTGVMGLPLCLTGELLKRIGYRFG